MIRKNDILAMARTMDSFTVQDLLCLLPKKDIYSRQSISVRLKRMVDKGLLQKKNRGHYSLANNGKKEFVAYFDSEMQDLENTIKAHFPFVRFTVWSSMDILPLSQHVANGNILYVDVEREASESVFNHLASMNGNRIVYYNPTEKDFERYIIGKPAIIVRTLNSEAPLRTFREDSLRISIEKILVDIVADDVFFSFQGYETIIIYRNAFNRYNVNERSLLRYAMRRNKRNEIINLIETIRND